MKGQNTYFDDGLSRGVGHNVLLGQFRRSVVLAIVAVLCLAWNVPAIADASYTVDAIAGGLSTAEAGFTDLRMEYVFTYSAWKEPNEPNGPKLVVEGVYAEKRSKKMSKRLRYLVRKHSVVDPNVRQVTLGEHTLASFNGHATRVLHSKGKSGELMEPKKGYILAGYRKMFFPRLYRSPHTKIWYFADKLLGEFLKEYRDKFHIESESEALDGISTVKLVGTWTEANSVVSHTMKLWVSPKHNFLPLKRQLIRTDGSMITETALYNLIELPNGMWYPRVIRSPADPPGAPNPRIAQIYDISKISIEPIPEEFFGLEFPPNTDVIDDILKVSYTTY